MKNTAFHITSTHENLRRPYSKYDIRSGMLVFDCGTDAVLLPVTFSLGLEGASRLCTSFSVSSWVPVSCDAGFVASNAPAFKIRVTLIIMSERDRNPIGRLFRGQGDVRWQVVRRSGTLGYCCFPLFKSNVRNLSHYRGAWILDLTRLADILGNKYVRVGSVSCERADEATKRHRGSVSVLLSSYHDDDGGGCVWWVRAPLAHIITRYLSHFHGLDHIGFIQCTARLWRI